MITTYWIWLVVASLAFVAFERLLPRRTEQPMLRRGIWSDVVYVVWNGHFVGGVVALAAAPLERAFRSLLDEAGLTIDVAVARGWPFAVQLVVAFVALDLLQWCIHNMLHRVPLLWQIHKVHHSIEELDWLGSLRFHWGEVVVYKTAQYVPLALLGFDPLALFIIAVVGTIIGHYNHSNVRVDLGPLQYVMNGPKMHQWHHVHPDAGPPNKNFAINLALWDWLFGTAFLPDDDRAPARLGFTDIERFPRNVVTQALWPLSALSVRFRRAVIADDR
jgi:sterol desaturase/sphingolipid hydroxylase (fatty acid hydroxylase superfamily)